MSLLSEPEASRDSPFAFFTRPLNSASSPSGTEASPAAGSLVRVMFTFEGKPKSTEPLSFVRRVGLR